MFKIGDRPYIYIHNGKAWVWLQGLITYVSPKSGDALLTLSDGSGQAVISQNEMFDSPQEHIKR